MLREFVTQGAMSGYRSGREAKTQEWHVLDLTGIMFSSIMMLIVIVRAVRADRTEAWFQTVKRREAPVEEKKSGWRRRT